MVTVNKHLSLLLVAPLLVVAAFVLVGIRPSPAQAAAGINSQLSFEGKIVKSDGTNITNGTYNMEFKIYQDGTNTGSGSTLLWTEDYLVAGSSGMPTTGGVTFTSGTFQVNLGSICAFSGGTCGSKTNTGVDFNQQTLWVSLQIGNTSPCTVTSGVTSFNTACGGDGEMTPFIRLTAVPYANNSAALGGIGAAGFVQLQGTTPGTAQTGNFNISGTGIAGSLQASSLDTASAAALGIGVSNATAINLGNSTSNIATTINGTELVEPTTGHDSATAFQVQSAGATNTLLTVDTQNNKVVVGDGAGTNTNTTQFIVDSSTADPSSGYNGSIYYNTTNNKFRCYQGGVWADCLAGTTNSTLSIVSGLANVGANLTGTPVESLVFTSATAVSNTAGATGFTAAAGGSFRSCLIKNNAAITAGTLSLRWRVNGVSVGSAACQMDTTNSRSSSSALDAGVVTFSQGDTIGIAFDTSSGYTPTTDDYTVYWTIEYNSTATETGATLQSAYNNYNILNTTDAHDVAINATDTATDANVLINLQCVTSCGSNGRFAVQNSGTDVFTVSPNAGDITATGKYNTNTFTSSALTFGAAATATLQSATSQALNISAHNSSTWSTDTGNLSIEATATNSTINLGANANDKTINIGAVGSTANATTIHIADTSGNSAQVITLGSTVNTGSIVTIQGGGAADTIVLQTAASGGIDIGVNNVATKTINIGSVGSTAQNTTIHLADSSAGVQALTAGSTNSTSSLTLRAGVNGTNETLQLQTAASGYIGIGTATNAVTINIGTGATSNTDASNVNIAASTNATGTQIVVIGSSAKTANSLSLEAGTGTTALFNGATAHTIQLATGAAIQSVTIGSTNSSSSTTIQGGSSGLTLITASGSSVQIGSSTTDANSTILVLDSYNQSADPTGVSGAMYYNTSTNTFRCYQNGAWVNCISPWIGITKTTAQDVTNSATYANDSVLQFPVTGGVTYTVRFYIVYSGSNATGDYKGEFLFPAAIAAKNVSGTYVSTTTADAIQSSAGVLGATTTFPSGGLSLGTAATVADQRVFQGTFSFQPNSSGTMNYQFANNAAAAGRISETCAGSYIEYQVQ